MILLGYFLRRCGSKTTKCCYRKLSRSPNLGIESDKCAISIDAAASTTALVRNENETFSIPSRVVIVIQITTSNSHNLLATLNHTSKTNEKGVSLDVV